MINRHRIREGHIVPQRELVGIRSERIRIPDPDRLIHLQFRRFAGCPVCNLHLHSIVQRHEEFVARSIREVVVFHSTTDALLPFTRDFPFAVIADPDKRLYTAFGVESAARSLLDPRGWPSIVRGILHSLRESLRGQRPLPSVNPKGGRFGLPADFLIARDGRVLACKYGAHVDDQWSVDEVLRLSARTAVNSLSAQL